MVYKINLKQLNEKILSNKLIIVDFFTTWCGECKMTEEVYEKLETVYKEMEFFAIDVDQEKLWEDDGNKEFNIKNVPTFTIFYKGKEIDRISNFQSEKNLNAFILKCLSIIKNEF